MPIKGWTDVPLRFPRLGTIALGVRNEEGYPVAVDHFVVPPEVQAVYGPRPRELDVVFPAEDLDAVASAWLKRYGEQFGLICRGDGETATLAGNYGKLDEYGVAVRDGAYCTAEGAVLETEERGGRVWVKIPCAYRQCRFYVAGKCREVVILSVILPRVPGVLGVYSLDTGSINSYRNIRDALMMLRAMVGRFSFIPLKLRVRMEEKHPMLADGRQVRREVPILYIDMGDLTLVKMLELARAGQLMASAMLPSAPSGIEIEPPDEDRKPELLYGPFPPEEAGALPEPEADYAVHGREFRPGPDGGGNGEAGGSDTGRKKPLRPEGARGAAGSARKEKPAGSGPDKDSPAASGAKDGNVRCVVTLKQNFFKATLFSPDNPEVPLPGQVPVARVQTDSVETGWAQLAVVEDGESCLQYPVGTVLEVTGRIVRRGSVYFIYASRVAPVGAA